ncbi:hypothetical protein [Luteitalea sp.]|uniref:hypothetical protein n=1 Tax=Luteitalea sp. TaxID=2004800 RepID=UPI0025B8FC34|nr:hypothetical protein [Luteitalea sp.]
MAEYPFRIALEEFRTWIEDAAQVPIEPEPLERFIELFAFDFAESLSHDRGDAVWRRDRRRLRNLARYLATIAEMHATGGRGATATIGEDELIAAFKIVKPHCGVAETNPATPSRGKYCSAVNV